MGQFHPVETFYSRQVKPLRVEADVYDCEIEGEVPAAIQGALYRVGPDTAFPTMEGDFHINGDGMISAFFFENGHVDFRCRYVKTERYLAERKARRRLYGKYRNPYTDDPSTVGTDRDNTANTYGFYHHGKLFALREDSKPTELDPDTLETIGDYDFGGAIQGLTMTAHPKIDPKTGEWWGFGLFAHKRYEGEMMLYVVDKDGTLIRQEEFRTPYPGLAHDFAVTRDHIIFPIMPLTVDVGRMKQGGDFYAYDHAKNPMFGVMPRNGTVADLRWYEVPRALFGHIMNAYSEGDVVHLDAAISPGNSFTFLKDLNGVPTDPKEGIASVTRLTFELSDRNDHVEMKTLPGTVGEMPRIDDRFAMRKYRYGYGKSLDGIMRVDWETGEVRKHLTPGGVTQEPIFVPRTPDAAEGDGWILCMTSYPAENRCELVILDAMEMEAPAVAKVKIPFNLPMAFHGMFAARDVSGRD